MMKLSISQVCSLNQSFAADIEDYASAGFQYVEIWLTKLEDFLAKKSLDDAQQLLRTHNMTPVAASYQGGLLTSQGEARAEAWKLFMQRLVLCRDLEIGVMVVACDPSPPLKDVDIQRLQMSLREMADRASEHRVRVALEFQASAALGNNLQTAAALVDDVSHPHLGICLDSFHFYVGPSKTEDLGYLSAHNLAHVQLSDLADKPRELALDGDRIIPGDGDLPLTTIVRHLQHIGYEGSISVELMNPQIWQIPALQIADVGLQALQRLIDS
jgi:sugar phosphate isomerase/epimerase